MSSARIQRDIEALAKGELDLGTLAGRIRALLGDSTVAADDVQRLLDEAHRKSDITAEDYNRLTVLISHHSGEPDQGSGADASPADTSAGEGAEVGDTVFVQPDSDASADSAETQLVDSDSGDTGSRDSSLGGDMSSPTIEVGTRLRDRFILDEVLGVGGMGTVYKGRDALKLEAQDRNPFVAVKILNESFKQRPEAFIALQREASRQQRLAHPNIATVYDFDRDGGVMFITMEYLDGRTLDGFIRDDVRPRNGLPFAEALPIIQDLCAALSHAHARGIVHADFKPGNCFLTSANHVKVLDFGIARAMKDPDSAPGDETLFDPRSIGALTPAYASPEMLTNSEEADPRDDIYALACVCYELLTGKHPFHRVPADQAKASDLKPERIRGLSRRQNAALRKALAFERAERLPSVDEFLRELRQETSSTRLLLRVVGIAAAVMIVVGLTVLLPDYLEGRQVETIVADLTSLDAARIDQGLVALEELEPETRERALLTSRSSLIDYYRGTFNSLMSADDDQVPFPDVGVLLTTGLSLYPDSAALAELKEEFDRRRAAYLAALTQRFENYLAPERLLPDPEGNDLRGLLERLAVVDPGNALLTDERIGAAYAAAVEAQLEQEEYGLAGRYLAVGLGLVPGDPTLSDLKDRLEAIEQQLARAEAIAALKTELAQNSSAVAGLDEVLTLVPTVEDLRALEGDAPEIAAAGALARDRLNDQLAALLGSGALQPLEDFLGSYQAAWEALDQPDVPAAVSARRDELLARENTLVETIRAGIGTADMLADGVPLTRLIDELRVIDPADPRADQLLAEMVGERQRRADGAIAQRNWDVARAELNAALELPLTPEFERELNDELTGVDQLEQRHIAGIEEQRLAAAEERERAERAEAEERERARRAAREAEVADAEAALKRAVAAFPGGDAVQATQQIQARMAALSALAPQSPALVETAGELRRLIEQHVRGIADTDTALAELGQLSDLTGSDDALAALRAELEEKRGAEREAERVATIRNAESALDAALADSATIEDAGVRRRAAQALQELESVASDQPDRVAAARQRYAAALLAAAGPLIDAKRFSLAEDLLKAARDATPDNPDVAGTTRKLDQARSAYREEREAQQALARANALRQRFELSVRAGELEQASAALRELRGADAADDFARDRAPEMLAEAYGGRASQALQRGDFGGARAAVTAGLAYAPNREALDSLMRSIDRAELQAGISAWFSGDRNVPATTVTQELERFRALSGEAFGSAREQWETVAMSRLDGLASDPAAYNALLQQLKLALPDSRALGRLEPLAPPPTLAVDDLLGNWCSDQSIRLELSRNQMRFDLGRQAVSYNVLGYDVGDDLISMRWQDQNKTLVFEFGRFSDAKDRMTQIRGREIGSNSWQEYNRSFRRCQ